MKHFLATTAIAALTAVPVMAETHSDKGSGAKAATSAEMSQGQAGSKAKSDMSTKVGDRKLSASNVIGQPVYIRASNAPDEAIADSVAQPAENWERVGEVSDVILTRDGKIDSVTFDAGGFLGLGEKQVRTSLDELKLVSSEAGGTAADGAAGDFHIVFTGDRSMLEDRKEVDRQSLRDNGYGFWSDEAAQQKATDGTDAQAAKDSGGNAEATQTAELTADQRNALTAQDLRGLAVYDSNDEAIGDISSLVVNENGDISEVVIDVGGFLGIGQKPVALPFEDVTLRQTGDGETNTPRATVSYTSEELENMPEWQG